jgi:hypothetical protein
MELTEAVKDLLVQAAKALKGSARRLFMARTVQALGEGGQRLVEREYARSMTWKGNHPVVELVTTAYQTGVKLTKAAMKVVESRLERMPYLEKWFVDIRYVSPAETWSNET